jgi:hypothetical protein
VIKTRLITMVLAWVVCLVPCSATAQQAAAKMLPDFTLPVPSSSEYQAYLGVTGADTEEFNVHDIDADILLIEMFSMYCPYCHAAAPAVNELYTLMQQTSQSGPRMRMIGLGANNTRFEVDHYQHTFTVAFPLFADKDMTLYRLLEGAGTPGFVGCRKNEDGKFEIIVQRSGEFDTPEGFLQELLERAGR